MTLSGRERIVADSLGNAVDKALERTLREALQLVNEYTDDRHYPNDLEQLRITIQHYEGVRTTDIRVEVVVRSIIHEALWKFYPDAWKADLGVFSAKR